MIHDRTYTVRSYQEAPDVMRLRGMVHDEKPPGLYFDDDPEPLSVHQMVVDLYLSFPSLEIIKAEVVMEVTPHRECVSIEPHYQKLVGLSIARGFSRQIKDLFGGPSGCTHIGALLQAMAPVAIQSVWSMRAMSGEGEAAVSINSIDTVEAKKRALSFNINTCHIWDEEGPMVKDVLAGGEMEVPVWAEERLVSLGRDPDEWNRLRGPQGE